MNESKHSVGFDAQETSRDTTSAEGCLTLGVCHQVTAVSALVRRIGVRWRLTAGAAVWLLRNRCPAESAAWNTSSSKNTESGSASRSKPNGSCSGRPRDHHLVVCRSIPCGPSLCTNWRLCNSAALHGVSGRLSGKAYVRILTEECRIVI